MSGRQPPSRPGLFLFPEVSGNAGLGCLIPFSLAFAECPWGSFLGSGARGQQPDQGSGAETPGQVKRAPRKGGVDARYSALILQLC